MSTSGMKDMINVRLERIEGNPWQTRMGVLDAESVKELALDIAMNGLLQVPVGRLVTDMGEGVRVPVEVGGLRWEGNTIEMKLHEGNALRVQLAFGHRRLEAFRLLNTILDYSNVGESAHTKDGWATMPVEIREMSDEEMARLAWSENEKREGVNAADRAKAIEQWMNDFGWSQAEVGEKLGLARSTVANILRLGGLPGHMLEALREGLISERVGMALLPMYRLPENILKMADKDWYCRPKDIEKGALDGKSSDSVRDDVGRLYGSYTVKLQGTLVKLDEVFPEGIIGGYDADGGEIYCGTCRACDLRLKDEGNICLDKRCFKAKEAVAKRRYLVQASQACGIATIDPSKGGIPSGLPYNQEDAKKILGTKCENLRLEYAVEDRKGDRKGDARYVEGWEHAVIVCDKRNQSCTCIKGLDLMKMSPARRVNEVVQAQKEADPEYEGEDVDVEYEGDDPEEDLVQMIDEEVDHEPHEQHEQGLNQKDLEEAARQARKAKLDVGKHYGEVREKIKKVLVEGLQNNQPGAYYLVLKGSPYVYRREELDMEKIYARLAENVVDAMITKSASSVDELYEIANRNLDQLGLDQVNKIKTLVEIFEEDGE